jgi:hypothetical protein
MINSISLFARTVVIDLDKAALAFAIGIINRGQTILDKDAGAFRTGLKLGGKVF